MKHLIYIIAITSLVLSSTLCSGQSVAEMKAFAGKMNTELIELAKAGRFEAMGKYYDPAAVSLPNYSAMEKGYSVILNNNLGRKKGGYTIVDGTKTTIEMFVGKDMFVDIGSFSLTVNFPGLAQPKVNTGKYLNVWRKDQEGNWRIIAETWNADKSPNAPAAK